VLAVGLLAVLVIQMAYGGLVAGLKAGHTSDTFPLMFGYLVPPGLLAVAQPWWINLVATATTVHFVHRWFAFVVLVLTVILLFLVRRIDHAAHIQRMVGTLVTLISVQIALGIGVIWLHVPLVLALSHQATALLLFVAVIGLNHQLWPTEHPLFNPEFDQNPYGQ
jgi:cytochrome c oxidase assembly protein subunit 15